MMDRIEAIGYNTVLTVLSDFSKPML